MPPILQTSLPYDPFETRALPGIRPLDMADWLHRDDAFAGQMALRDKLIQENRSKVIALDPTAAPAAVELLGLVRDLAYPGRGRRIDRADGVSVPVDPEDPLASLGRLVQEDFCILQKIGDEHVLTGAVLCFPASWSLDEKIMRPLIRIHEPVGSYDDGIARRVQRLFEGVQPERPLWRFNALWYADPDLHQPRREYTPRQPVGGGAARYFRSERQCILRLPETRAVVFSIHTYVLDRSSLPNPDGIGPD